jgi:serine/threonine-protein kinase
VDQALAGEQGSSKECLIGMYIFGRRPDYDPSTDPIVRVEARRLRRKLAAYYANGGRHDPVRIEVPKGAYRPVFESQTGAADREKPSIAVLPFSDRSATHEYEALVDGITLRLISRLAACEDLRVVSSTSVFQYKNLFGGRAPDRPRTGRRADPRRQPAVGWRDASAATRNWFRRPMESIAGLDRSTAAIWIASR